MTVEWHRPEAYRFVRPMTGEELAKLTRDDGAGYVANDDAPFDDGSFDSCSLGSKALTWLYLTLGAWVLIGGFGAMVWMVFK